ncbi:hypothetical protein B0H16DRAFT_1478309 [Mycena metata]|uniref:Uncharacterized protein n=1 Tax=Mycena metata TaxID=1033252 RepID=A0AAD7H7M4_9AGAR|nr:hypothetical protein B0H16DRAFT_1478309 [Mycena metata]
MTLRLSVLLHLLHRNLNVTQIPIAVDAQYNAIETRVKSLQQQLLDNEKLHHNVELLQKQILLSQQEARFDEYITTLDEMSNRRMEADEEIQHLRSELKKSRPLVQEAQKARDQLARVCTEREEENLELCRRVLDMQQRLNRLRIQEVSDKATKAAELRERAEKAKNLQELEDILHGLQRAEAKLEGLATTVRVLFFPTFAAHSETVDQSCRTSTGRLTLCSRPLSTVGWVGAGPNASPGFCISSLLAIVRLPMTLVFLKFHDASYWRRSSCTVTWRDVPRGATLMFEFLPTKKIKLDCHNK